MIKYFKFSLLAMTLGAVSVHAGGGDPFDMENAARSFVAAPAEMDHFDVWWSLSMNSYYMKSGAWEGIVHCDDAAPMNFDFANPVAKRVPILNMPALKDVYYPGVVYQVVGKDREACPYKAETLEMTYKGEPSIDLKNWKPVNEEGRVGWMKISDQ